MKSGLPESVNILLVEDDEIDAEVVQRAFRKRNMKNRIYHARYGSDALAMLAGDAGHHKVPAPCLLLVDVNMPKMTGIEFLERLRADPRSRNNMVFMLSTSRRDADIMAAYRLGAAGYFLKDTVDDVVDMLEKYLYLNKFADARHPTTIAK